MRSFTTQNSRELSLAAASCLVLASGASAACARPSMGAMGASASAPAPQAPAASASSSFAAPPAPVATSSSVAWDAPSAPSASASASVAASASQVAPVAAATSSSAESTSEGSSSSSSSSSSSGTKYMMVFGDSYSSTGFWAGGDQPSTSNPMGNPTLPGTTTTGGLNWVGMVTTEYNTSLVLTYDFAVYGATVDSDIVRGASTNMDGEVDEFNEYVGSASASGAVWSGDDTLAAVWIGINDVGNPYWDGEAAPITTDQDEYFDLMQNLTDAGVTNFAFLSVPPFQYAPDFVDESNRDVLVSNITAYNDALATRVAKFEAANDGVTAQLFNTTPHFMQAIDNPTEYNATDATCDNADGTTCLWYDGYHAGQAIHRLVAKAFVESWTGTFF